MQSEAHTLPRFSSLNFAHSFFRHLTGNELLSVTGVQPGERGHEDLKLSMEKGNRTIIQHQLGFP